MTFLKPGEDSVFYSTNFSEISGLDFELQTEDVMNVKASPVLIEDLLHEDAFLPAYHMNKKYWVSIRLDFVTEDAIRKLIDGSWNLVRPKLKKRKIDL